MTTPTPVPKLYHVYSHSHGIPVGKWDARIPGLLILQYGIAIQSIINSAVSADFGACLGVFILLNQIYLTVRQYHSDLSDQSAPEISVRISVRPRVALF